MGRALTGWRYRFAMCVAGCALWTGPAVAKPHAADPAAVLCVAAGQALQLDVRFHDTPPAGIRITQQPGGRQVASFHGQFGQGADASWRAGAGLWRSADGPACYRISGVHGAPGAPLTEIPAVCLVDSARIGFAAGPQQPLFATVRYLGAQIQAGGSTCGAFPASRDGATASTSGRGSAAAAADHEPSATEGFPWPPPRPSTRRLLPRPMVTGAALQPTLGGVADRLQAALESAGYVEYGYYPVPGGFALATRLERIHPDGRAYTEPARWQWGQAALTGFDLGSYVRALFDVEQGYFRVIVFAVTTAPLETTDDAPQAEQVLAWPMKGAPELPPALRRQSYGDDAYSAALVYEFESRGRGHEATFRSQSRLTGDAHLRQARLLPALE